MNTMNDNDDVLVSNSRGRDDFSLSLSLILCPKFS
mgnify:FL=1